MSRRSQMEEELGSSLRRVPLDDLDDQQMLDLLLLVLRCERQIAERKARGPRPRLEAVKNA